MDEWCVEQVDLLISQDERGGWVEMDRVACRTIIDSLPRSHMSLYK